MGRDNSRLNDYRQEKYLGLDTALFAPSCLTTSVPAAWFTVSELRHEERGNRRIRLYDRAATSEQALLRSSTGSIRSAFDLRREHHGERHRCLWHLRGAQFVRARA